MIDETEDMRRLMTAQLNSEAAERAALEAKHGQVWNTEEMQRDFQALGFGAPLIVVVRKSDNQKGSLFFQNSPRFYFNFEAHTGR